MGSTLRHVVVTALALGTVALTPGAASAETVRLPDHGADMGHYADAESAVIRHTSRALVVKVQHQSLRRTGDAGISMFIDTDRRRSGPEFVLHGGLYEGTDYALWRARGLDRTGQMLMCPYRMKADYATDATLVRVSRTCLGGPARVRTAVRVTGGFEPDFAEDWVGAQQWTEWLDRS